jgi:hypothetical protein
LTIDHLIAVAKDVADPAICFRSMEECSAFFSAGMYRLASDTISIHRSTARTISSLLANEQIKRADSGSAQFAFQSA